MAATGASAGAQAAARLRSAKHRKETAQRPAKVARAYQLRVEGLSERQIAARMGISPYSAHVYVTEALSAGMAEIHERGRDFVRLELDRLEQPVRHLQRRIRRGDADAIREHRSLSESRRKLLGLDARPDADPGSGREIQVTFKFPDSFVTRQPEPAHADIQPSGDVGGGNVDGGRSAPLPVDRDGDKNR